MIEGDDPGDSQPMQVGKIEQLTETPPKRNHGKLESASVMPPKRMVPRYPEADLGKPAPIKRGDYPWPPNYGNGDFVKSEVEQQELDRLENTPIEEIIDEISTDLSAEELDRALEEISEAVSKDMKEQEALGNDLSAGGGERLNKGKLRMDLLPPEWPWALSDVLTKGVMKGYEARNWEKGMEWSAMVGCFERHVKKFQAGERYDGVFDLEKGTTGCHHLAMAAWNILGLMSYDLREIGRDDLPRDVTVQTLNRVNADTSDLGETRDDA